MDNEDFEGEEGQQEDGGEDNDYDRADTAEREELIDFAIQDLFDMYGEDQDRYYDFSKALEAPSCKISFNNMRML